MPKNTKEKNSITNNLEYIGLDLNNIPEFLLDYRDIDFKPSKVIEENTFKIYRYVNLKDIEILLTPKNRLDSIYEKYMDAVPLNMYLDSENEENIVRYAELLKMFEHLNIKEVEQIDKQQKAFNKKVPFKVKYDNNYLWQVYYSEYTGKYFMMVTIEDLDYSCFFYLLKKKIELNKTGKDEFIFIPISGTDYTKRYLKRSEISDLEKYIWLFTKQWPQIYEVFDYDNELVMHIVGKTDIYDGVETWYKNELKTKEESDKFYKFIKALFILQTELPHYYKFNTQIGENGELIFEHNSRLINYECLSKLINDEYKKYSEQLKNIFEEKEKLDIKLEKLKNEEKEKNLEYLFKEKQVATYLECRTSIFGRIKYFFKSKNGKFIREKIKNKNKEIKQQNKIEKDISNSIIEEKEYYTIEDLIKVCIELDRIEIRIKNSQIDINALEDKINNLNNKIKNANIFIQKIEEHKKSIFEFWKFANKDESIGLNPGQEEKETKKDETLKKIFKYEEDIEDLGILADKIQREKLTKKECDSLFIASTEVLDDINKIKQEKRITKASLDQIKEEAKKEVVLFNSENFDIFGNVKEDKTKISILANKKHREAPKDKFKILDISKDLSLEEYMSEISNQYKTIEKAILKSNTIVDMSAYLISEEKLNNNELKVFHINPNLAIEEASYEEKIHIHKIDLKEGMNTVYYTNIIYYDNNNNTLPLGMNITDKILVDLSKFELRIKKQKIFRINQDINEIENKVKIVCVYEYELKNK